LTGSFVVVSGKAKTGKSSSILTLAANFQREEYGKRNVYFLDCEHRLKRLNVLGIKGLILDNNRFNIVRSTQEKILSSEDYLTIAEKILKTDRGCMLIIDSVSALAEEKSLTEGCGVQTRGAGNKIISQFINNVSGVITASKGIIVCVIHLIANTSGWGSPIVEKTPTRLTYAADYRLRVQKSVPWKVGTDDKGKQIGLCTTFECLASALAPPGIQVDSYFRFNVGVDKIFEMINLGVSANLIEEKGAGWKNVEFLKKYPELVVGTEYEGKEVIKVQGNENLYQMFVKYPSWGNKLELELKNMIVGKDNEEEI